MASRLSLQIIIKCADGIGMLFLKELDTIGKLLKVIVSIKTHLVTSNGELLVVYNIVRNGSLLSNLVFEKKVEILTKILGFRPIKKKSHLNAHKFVQQWSFYFIIFLQLRWRTESAFSQICI